MIQRYSTFILLFIILVFANTVNAQPGSVHKFGFKAGLLTSKLNLEVFDYNTDFTFGFKFSSPPLFSKVSVSTELLFKQKQWVSTITRSNSEIEPDFLENKFTYTYLYVSLPVTLHYSFQPSNLPFKSLFLESGIEPLYLLSDTQKVEGDGGITMSAPEVKSFIYGYVLGGGFGIYTPWNDMQLGIRYYKGISGVFRGLSTTKFKTFELTLSYFFY